MLSSEKMMARKRGFCLGLFLIVLILGAAPFVYAQERDIVAEEEAAVKEGGITFFGLLKAGGFIMWPIALGSVAMVALIIEHGITLQTKKILPPAFEESVKNMIREQRLEEARQFCDESAAPIARITKEALGKLSYGREATEQVVGDVGSREVLALNRKISWLSVIGVLEPMLGLLGTVTGMIAAFQVISAGGAGKPALLAKGVSEALITTAAGLTVAIPAMLGHFIFKNIVQKLNVNIEIFSTNLIDFLFGTQEEVPVSGQQAKKSLGMEEPAAAGEKEERPEETKEG